MANPIDLTMTVTLAPSADADTVDANVRSAISLALNNASTKLYQSSIIQQVQAVTGVTNIEVPLQKCAKSDGAYDIGVVVPTQTGWNPLGADPAFSAVKVPSQFFHIRAANPARCHDSRRRRTGFLCRNLARFRRCRQPAASIPSRFNHP